MRRVVSCTNTMDIDLGNISDKLSEEFPQVERIYLFGSRRYKTKSSRSDIDLLIEFNDHVKQKRIIEFSEELCSALDIFKLENGKATSFHNDSYIEYDDNSELLQNLNAIEIWNKREGRQKADIDWIANIDDRASYPPTSLPNRNYSAVNSLDINPADLEIGQLFSLIGKLKPGQFWGFISVLFIILSSIFYGGYYFADFNSPNNISSQSLTQLSDSLISDSSKLGQEEQSNPIDSESVDLLLPSFSPEIFSVNDGDGISSIREKNNLRQITTFESGKAISELPSRTFFFTSIYFLRESKFEMESVLDTKVQRFKSNQRSDFETHKYSEEEIYLVGYVPESALSNVSKFDGKSVKKITVFPSHNKLTSHGIIIPLSRIIASDLREIQVDQENPYLNALDLQVK